MARPRGFLSVFVLFVIGFAFIVFLSIQRQSDNTAKPTPRTSAAREAPDTGSGKCREFIELLSAAEIARKHGKTEMWALSSHRINLWTKSTPQGKWPHAGKMIPGSRAVILETGPEDYKVHSPLDGSVAGRAAPSYARSSSTFATPGAIE